GFRRGTMDGGGRERHRRAGTRAHRVALRAVRLTRSRSVPEPGAVGDALRVRRPPRKEVARAQLSCDSQRDRPRAATKPAPSVANIQVLPSIGPDQVRATSDHVTNDSSTATTARSTIACVAVTMNEIRDSTLMRRT